MFFSSQTEVYIYREPVDMRKGHDGLAGIVESEREEKSMSTVNLREDLKSNPKYLNEVIKVMDSSIVALKEENKTLLDLLESSSQSELIELKDKIAMLNKHAFGSSESLNKHRPRRETQRELLPHN